MLGGFIFNCWKGIKAGGIRLLLEIFKVLPLLALLIYGAKLLGDTSHLRTAGYFLMVVILVVGIFHIVRKFMYPTVSIEAHCKSALEGHNAASAIIVAVFIGFQVCMAVLVAGCFMLMMASPPRITMDDVNGVAGGQIIPEQVQRR